MGSKVFIILLNYNGAKDTIECVKSLEEIDYDNYEILVVDNYSTDNSFDFLSKSIGYKHHVISSGKNGGFAFGNNIGIKYAMQNNADYVLLINNDTIVKKDFLSKLFESLSENKNFGIVTGLILNYYEKNKIWYGGGEINWKRFYGYHCHENQDVDSVNLQGRNITFATGCLMLISVNTIKEVGLLPEEYFMYYEDVDYCAKVQEKGFSIYFNPNCVIYHKISASSGEYESAFAVMWNTKNRLKFIKKYKYKVSRYNYIKVITFFYITRIIKILDYFIKKRKDKAKALLNGLRR